MKKAEFIMWLRGYFTTIDKTKTFDQVLIELIAEIELLDLNLRETTIERIIIKEIEHPFINPNNPFIPPFPYGTPIVTMYGCNPPNVTYGGTPPTDANKPK